MNNHVINIPSQKIKASIFINRPVETVALHLSETNNFKDWNPIENEVDFKIAEHLPFKKISVIDESGSSWVRRTLIFEPVNSHGTTLTYIEEQKFKGLFGLLLGRIQGALALQQINGRLEQIKFNLEEKKLPAWTLPPAVAWTFKSIPRFLKHP